MDAELHCSEVEPWTDFNPAWPDDAMPEPRRTLAELVQAEAAAYRALRTEAADLIAETLETLVRGIRSTSATTPDQYRERIEALDRMADYDAWHAAEEQGYYRALAECGR